LFCIPIFGFRIYGIGRRPKFILSILLILSELEFSLLLAEEC